MKFLSFFVIAILCSVSFAQNQQLSSDTIITQSNGWGQSADEATNNAIRNGVETSMGLYISSSTLIDNYSLVRDIIHSSTDGYCFKYDLLNSSFDKGTGLYHTGLKVYVANKRLISDVTSKISNNNKIDISAIDKLKFELSQKKQRAKSSLLYLSNFIQQNYQKPFNAAFDSIHILNSNQSNNTANVEFYFSLSWNQEALNTFSEQSSLLSTRANQYADRNIYIIYHIQYSAKLANVKDNEHFVLENIPHQKCADCGESWDERDNSNELAYAWLFF